MRRLPAAIAVTAKEYFFNLADLPSPGPFLITKVKSKEQQADVLRVLATTKPPSSYLSHVFARLRRTQERRCACAGAWASAITVAAGQERRSRRSRNWLVGPTHTATSKTWSSQTPN